MRLIREPLHLVVPADHRLAQFETVEPEKLTSETVLAMERAHRLHNQIATLCERFATPEAQRRHIDAVLRARHRRDLAVADWEDDEVARLGYVLRTAVLNGIDGRERAKARLAWPRRRPKGE